MNSQVSSLGCPATAFGGETAVSGSLRKREDLDRDLVLIASHPLLTSFSTREFRLDGKVVSGSMSKFSTIYCIDYCGDGEL